MLSSCGERVEVLPDHGRRTLPGVLPPHALGGAESHRTRLVAVLEAPAQQSAEVGTIRLRPAPLIGHAVRVNAAAVPELVADYKAVALLEVLRRAAPAGSDERAAGRHGLEGREAEALSARRQNEDVDI